MEPAAVAETLERIAAGLRDGSLEICRCEASQLCLPVSDGHTVHYEPTGEVTMHLHYKRKDS